MQGDRTLGPVRTRMKTIDDITQFNRYIGTDLSKLQADRDSLGLVLRYGLIKSIFDYAKNNSDSFVSLYLLTRTGTEVAHEGFYEALNTLNPYLKSHSRAKKYTE